jgi:multidrug efflux pump subunit AcrA (membrane-fusion protein)
VFELLDLNKTWLRGLVEKAASETFKPGSIVNVQFQEIQKEVFSGKIVSVTSDSVEKMDGKDMCELRIELDNPSNNVLPGMEATVTISY